MGTLFKRHKENTKTIGFSEFIASIRSSRTYGLQHGERQRFMTIEKAERRCMRAGTRPEL